MRNKMKYNEGSGTPDPFNRAVPGYSLTQEPGTWPWEKPPKMTHPAEVVDSIIDRFEEPDTQEELLNMMISGISIEELVNVFAIHGIDRGMYTPDVAEIIKGPLSYYLLGLAAENNVPVKFFGNEEEYRKRKRGMSESQLLSVMKRRNPEAYEALMATVPPGVDEAMAREKRVGESFLRERVPPREPQMDTMEEPRDMDTREDYEEGEE